VHDLLHSCPPCLFLLRWRPGTALKCHALLPTMRWIRVQTSLCKALCADSDQSNSLDECMQATATSCARAHTHTHTHIFIRTLTHAHACSYMLTQARKSIHVRTAHTRTCTCMLMHLHALAYTCNPTHIHTRTHTHTHARAYALPLSRAKQDRRAPSAPPRRGATATPGSHAPLALPCLCSRTARGNNCSRMGASW